MFSLKPSSIHKVVSAFLVALYLLVSLIPVSVGSAQMVLSLPVPGAMLNPSSAYMPPTLKGLILHPKNPFQFDFIMDTGDHDMAIPKLKSESNRLIKYFLAALTVPEDDLWVNLSPYEKDRIIPQAFGETELGRDLLAQDYMLKQLTASLVYPEENIGQDFWERVYEIAAEKYGTTQIPVNTFNKVWIVPDKAVVFAEGQMAYVIESHLKVMLEDDYVAMKKSAGDLPWQDEGAQTADAFSQEYAAKVMSQSSPITTDIIREIIIPEIEKEINQGENFSSLRQIFNAVILAKWYKSNLKENIINREYVNKNKILGVDVEDKEIKYKIYEQYLIAFRKGVYNFVKEDYDPVMQTVLARKYFSGGSHMNPTLEVTQDRAMLRQVQPTGRLVRLDSEMVLSKERIQPPKAVLDAAMLERSNIIKSDPQLRTAIEQLIEKYAVFSADQLAALERFELLELYDRLLEDNEQTPEGLIMRMFYDANFILMYESVLDVLAQQKNVPKEEVRRVLSIGAQNWNESIAMNFVLDQLQKNIGFDIDEKSLERAKQQVGRLAAWRGQTPEDFPFQVSRGDARLMAQPQFLRDIVLNDQAAGREAFDLITFVHPDAEDWMHDKQRYQALRDLVAGVEARLTEGGYFLMTIDEETWMYDYRFFYDLLRQAGFEHLSDMPDLVALGAYGFAMPRAFGNFLEDKKQKSRVLLADRAAVRRLVTLLDQLNALIQTLQVEPTQDGAKQLSFYLLKQNRNVLIEAMGLLDAEAISAVVDKYANQGRERFTAVKKDLSDLLEQKSAQDGLPEQTIDQAMLAEALSAAAASLQTEYSDRLIAFDHIWLFSNDKRLQDILQRLEQTPLAENAVHFGLGGLYNLDIIAKRKTRFALIADVQAEVGRIYAGISRAITAEAALDESVSVTVRRAEFIERLIDLFEQDEVFFYNLKLQARQGQTRAQLAALYQPAKDQLRAELARADSWLGSDEAFQHVQQMFQDRRIVFTQMDFTRTDMTRKFGQWLRAQRLELDTVYLTNLYKTFAAKERLETDMQRKDEFNIKKIEYHQSVINMAAQESLIIQGDLQDELNVLPLRALSPDGEIAMLKRSLTFPELLEGRVALTAPAEEEAVGGIDLTAPLMELKTIGNYIVTPIDNSIQDLDTLRIDGLIPVIHTITPVTSLPFLLSELNPEDQESPAISG